MMNCRSGQSILDTSASLSTSFRFCSLPGRTSLYPWASGERSVNDIGNKIKSCACDRHNKKRIARADFSPLSPKKDRACGLQSAFPKKFVVRTQYNSPTLGNSKSTNFVFHRRQNILHNLFRHSLYHINTHTIT